jgi:hypothetical protein
MRLPPLSCCRRGTTTLEAVIVLGVLLTVVTAMLDLGIALFRQHQLSYAARAVCRTASVHGSEAGVLGSWGPASFGPVAASTTGPIPEASRPHLCSLKSSDVTVQLEWPDASNEPGYRVAVTLESSYQPALTWLFGAKIKLRASSIMPISH